MIELGSKVRDRVSGLEGIVIGRTQWLSGCDRLVVQPPVKDGKRPDADSFDEHMLDVLETPEQTGVKGYAQVVLETAEEGKAAALLPGGPAPSVRRW